MEQNYKQKKILRAIKNKAIGISLLIIFAIASPGIFYAQNSYTFTNAGATGSLGPTQAQINTAYSSTNLNGSVTIQTGTPGIQTWTVPQTMGYRIEARGAQGYGTNGGRGAVIAGDYTLTAGTVLKILVGQKGEAPISPGTNQYGGGGGSYVTNLANSPYVVAGGGGGSWATSYTGLSDGTVTTNGNAGSNGPTNGAGGTAGGGGGTGGYADGGGGITGNGSGTTGGMAFINGGTGGAQYGHGGFGGGAGGSSWDNRRGCGGGGYSGGGGAGSTTTGYPEGGGGGSFNGGVNQLNSAGTNTGQGSVIITELCNIRIYASGSNSVAPSICSGTTLTLTTNAVSNYTWSTGNTTSTMITVSPTSSQTYSIVGTGSLACVAAGSISVTVSAGLPVLTITNTPNTLCLGKSTSVTAGGALTYTWSNGASTTPVLNGVAFTPTATASYTVMGENGCGISTSVTAITIAPLVVTSSANPSLVCAGSQATLTASSSVTGYTWSPNSIAANPVVLAPLVNTVYTVTASDGTCVGTSTVAVNTKPTPTLSIVASNSMICEGALVTMTASGALTYTWNFGNSNSASISDNPVIATAYQVTGTNSLNCTALASQIVVTMPNPTISIAASKTIVCMGDPITFTASGANTYTWVNGPSTATNAINLLTSSIYTVSGTVGQCSSDKTISVNVLTASVAASAAIPSLCVGGTTTLTASGANSYVWIGHTSFNGKVIVSPTVTTNYSVNATTTIPGLSCPSSTNITVTVFNNPTVTIATTKTVLCKADAPIVLTGSGAVTYTWSTNTVSTTISIHPQSTITYTVTGTDANGCVSTATKLIQVNNCNSIGELTGADKGILVYPNPNGGEFAISSSGYLDLKLVNELGQEIRIITLSGQNNHRASVSDLAKGIYFIVGQNNNGRINQKIIVTK